MRRGGFTHGGGLGAGFQQPIDVGWIEEACTGLAGEFVAGGERPVVRHAGYVASADAEKFGRFGCGQEPLFRHVTIVARLGEPCQAKTRDFPESL